MLKCSTSDNLMEKKADGCNVYDAVITKKVAEALREVQEDLMINGGIH